MILFFKALVAGYTRGDGVVVKPHADKRIARRPGDNVMFPHPDKPGKKALGKYVRDEGEEHSVVHHEKHGELKFHHKDVIGARGVPASGRHEDIARINEGMSDDRDAARRAAS